MLFERGDIVLLAFPFSSEAGVKQRPALILLEAKDQDLLVARVTTQRHQSAFDIAVNDWKRGVCWLRPGCEFTSLRPSKSGWYAASWADYRMRTGRLRRR